MAVTLIFQLIPRQYPNIEQKHPSGPIEWPHWEACQSKLLYAHIEILKEWLTDCENDVLYHGQCYTALLFFW